MKYAIIGIIAVAGVGFGWYTLSPLFIDNVVDEALEFNRDENMDDTSSADSTTEDASEPTVRAQGSFTGADSVHQGSGTAYVVEGEAETILRFEDFSVTNGPDLFVVLSKSENPADDLGEHIILEELKGNIGNQNYTIPAEIDVSAYKSIVIYCKAFSVVFASAQIF